MPLEKFSEIIAEEYVKLYKESVADDIDGISVITLFNKVKSSLLFMWEQEIVKKITNSTKLQPVFQ